jgi:NTP pyrophosphatase (non-canonical NTP hydrolase)
MRAKEGEVMATEKFVSPVAPPEGIDRELLTILAEECCEVGQRVSKALRFGLSEIQLGQPLDNAQRISEELGDLLGVVDELLQRDVLKVEDINRAAVAKTVKLARFMQSDI